MKKILLLMFACCPVVGLMAQKNLPKWVDKARKAVFTVTTYGKDGNKIATTNGFFITETGEGLSAYDVFKGAFKATVTDAEGKEYEVKNILGADEMYDVVKFQVAIPKKVQPLDVVPAAVADGTVAYMLPYSPAKAVNLKSGNITEVSNMKDGFKYYKAAISMNKEDVNLPLLTPEGQVFAMSQPDAGGKTDVTYGLSARYAKEGLNVGAMDFLNSAYKNIGIMKAWPKDADQASVALYLLANSEDAQTHLNTINSFIETFPNSPEGYTARSNQYAFERENLPKLAGGEAEYLKKALEDAETAGNVGNKKGEASFNKAKLIYSVLARDTTLSIPDWTMDNALNYLEAALKENNDALYHQLKGDILFLQQKYPEAL